MKSQKVLGPLLHFPQQIQNSGFVRKLQNLTGIRNISKYGSYLSSTYGNIDKPTAIAVDESLGLFAVGSHNGSVRIYGAPGIVFGVTPHGPKIVALEFIEKEGRILVARNDGRILLYELNVKDNTWIVRSQLLLPLISSEEPTSLAHGAGIVYIGSSLGTLRQIIINDSKLILGDEDFSTCTSGYVLDKIPLSSRGELDLSVPIISLEYLTGSINRLLIAYATGCVVVAEPRPFPDNTSVKTAAEQPLVAEGAEQPASQEAAVGDEAAHEPINEPNGDADATDTPADVIEQSGQPSTPVKVSEKRATLNFKALARTLRLEHTKSETSAATKVVNPLLPRITHVLLRDQQAQWATWSCASGPRCEPEATVAYSDGSFQRWPITTSTGDDAMVVSARDPPTTPYGPLPCSAIRKLLIHPAAIGGSFTAFAGGLPRPQFDQRHAVTVMQDHDHHVCFEFASPVVDFYFIAQTHPDSSDESDEATDSTKPETASCRPASALLVMTERELVVIDLVSNDWPSFASPYLGCVDLAIQQRVTTIAHLSDVPPSLIKQLTGSAGYSQLDWPIWAGRQQLEDNVPSDLVLLGRDDGSVELMSLGRGDTCNRLANIDCSQLFQLDDSHESNLNGNSVGQETWPPFRRVGHFTTPPRTDARLAITCLDARVTTDDDEKVLEVVVGGAGGHVSVWRTSPSTCLHRIEANFVKEEDAARFVWNGLPSLKPAMDGGDSAILIPTCLVQLQPPSPITSVCYAPAWKMLAVGSCQGFVLIELNNSPRLVHTEFVNQPTNETAPATSRQSTPSVAEVQAAIVSQGKKLSANMRRSFRKLKDLGTSMTASPSRSSTAAAGTSGDTPATGEGVATAGDTEIVKPSTDEAAVNEPAADQPQEPADAPTTPTADIEQPVVDAPLASVEPVNQTGDDLPEKEEPVPPQPIQLSSSKSAASCVRSIALADACIGCRTVDKKSTTPVLCIGTFDGLVRLYTLTWSLGEDELPMITVKQCHQLQLQHRGAVLGLAILDADNGFAPVDCSPESCQPIIEDEQQTPSQPEQGDNVKEADSKPTADSAPPTEPAEATTDSAPADAPESTTAASTGETATTTCPEVSKANPAPTVRSSHLLLVCTSDQLKLVSLANWRTMAKRRLVKSLGLDRFSAIKRHLISPAPLESVPDEPEEADQSQEDKQQPAAASSQEPQPEVKSQPAQSQFHRKSVIGFALQSFVRSNNPFKVEWNVVLSVHCGQTLILNLPDLWRVFKVKNPPTPLIDGLSPCLAWGQTNLILWPAQCNQLVACEISPLPRLSSPVAPLPSNVAATTSSSTVRIWLPEWARPIVVEQIEEKAEAENGNDQANDDSQPAEPTLNGHADEEGKADPKNSGDMIKPSSGGAGQELVTETDIDTLKHCLNESGQGKMTVKTMESSTEKRTLVEGGQVITTIHETEKVDGKITKDDIVKIASNNDEKPAGESTTA